MENKNDTKVRENPEEAENHPQNIYDLEEIEIEEMAIDGICGVY